MAEKINATWFDAGSSRRQAATLWFADGMLHVQNESGEARCVPLREVNISARLANLPRKLQLPDGVLLNVEDNSAIDDAIRARGGGVVHVLESRWQWAVALLLAASGVAYAAYAHGLPAASTYVAGIIPQEYKREISEEVYNNLHYQEILNPTRLSALQQRRAHVLFDKVRGDLSQEAPVRGDLQLALNQFGYSDADIPNAFAFPDGLVVITDEMMRLLDDDEVIAVIAHEIGHVHHDHGMRGFVQAVGVAGFVFFLFGDFSGLATVPVVLANLKYSRDFEREADCYAYHYLVAQEMSPALVGRALTKMEQHSDKLLEEAEKEWMETSREILEKEMKVLAEKRADLQEELQARMAQMRQIEEAEEARRALRETLAEAPELLEQYEKVESLEREFTEARKEELAEEIAALEEELDEVNKSEANMEKSLKRLNEKAGEKTSEDAEGAEEEKDSDLWLGVLESLSTHPPTEERADLAAHCT